MAASDVHFSMGRFKMSILEETTKNSFLTHVEQIEGCKAILWDQELMGPVTLLRVTRQLKDLGVVEMFSLVPLGKDFPPHMKAQHIIFVVRPTIVQMDLVADYIHGINRLDRGKIFKREFSVLFIPHTSQACERQLTLRGVLGSVNLKSTEIYMFPFDSDLMSMEMTSAYKEYIVDKDPTMILEAATALVRLDALYGPFPHVIGRGPAAKVVADRFSDLIQKEKTSLNDVPIIHHVVIIDRQVDLVTPLTTQLTYEGLIDEFYGINNTTALFPPEPFAKEEDEPITSQPTVKKLVYLNSSDELYADLRDRNFNGVGPTLHERAQSVQQQQEKRHDKTMENMKKFVNELPQLLATKKSLALHTAIAELIRTETETYDFLDNLQAQQELLCSMEIDSTLIPAENAMYRKTTLLQVLRLLSIQSLVNNGLKPSLLHHYKQELMDTYGPKLLVPLANLEKAGLLKPHSPPRNYASLSKLLRLIVETDSEVTPTDISFTHTIYAPLSIRLVENFKNWSNLKDVLDMVEGPTVEFNPYIIPAHQKTADKQVVLVFFIGGCTYTEIAALRFLSQKPDSEVDYVIATTKLINGNTFLKAIMAQPSMPDLDFDNLTLSDD